MNNYCKLNLYDEIWKKFFDLKNKEFYKNGYQFNHMIKTDGIACSIIFVNANENKQIYAKPTRSELDEINYWNGTKYFEAIDNKICLKSINNVITELNRCEIRDLKSNMMVTIDPGQGKSFDCVGRKLTSDKTEDIRFIYTSRQYKSEIKAKRYTDIRQNLKGDIINEKMIIEHEEKLSKCDSKTTDFKKFEEYIKIKNSVSNIVLTHYKNKTYRQLKWNTYNNKRRIEDNLVNRFEATYGNPSKCVIFIGDYSECHSKGKIVSSKTKWIRHLFENRGYTVYLLDEYNTSKICSCCGCKTEQLKRKNIWQPRKKRKPKEKKNKKRKISEVQKQELIKRLEKEKLLRQNVEKITNTPEKQKERQEKAEKYKESRQKNTKIWKLTRCQSEQCRTIHNRDSNANKNMHQIIKHIFENKKRPIKFTEEFYKQEKWPIEENFENIGPNILMGVDE